MTAPRTMNGIASHRTELKSDEEVENCRLPPGHPARERWDTVITPAPGGSSGCRRGQGHCPNGVVVPARVVRAVPGAAELCPRRSGRTGSTPRPRTIDAEEQADARDDDHPARARTARLAVARRAASMRVLSQKPSSPDPSAEADRQPEHLPQVPREVRRGRRGHDQQGVDEQRPDRLDRQVHDEREQDDEQVVVERHVQSARCGRGSG